MRKALSAFLGFFSAVAGLLIVLPRINERSMNLQVVLNELPWLPWLMGVLALKKPRSGLGVAFGLVGVLLASVPFSRFGRAQRDMQAMMTEALGAGYEGRIPAQVRAALAQSPLWVADMAGRGFKKHKAAFVGDVPFAETPERTLKLDIHSPPTPPLVHQRYPAVIVIHWGGWRNGDKGGYFLPHHRRMAAQGYMVFDIQYRLTAEPGVQWPKMLEDVQAAIRWVKAHADFYNIDPERIALLGRSAGGHLALQAAYCADEALKVRAVIGFYAPTNLFISAPEPSPATQALLGGHSYQVPGKYTEASPITHVRDDLPPTLLIHGQMDQIATLLHSEMLLNRLRTTNTPCAVLRVPWGRHGFDAITPGLGAHLVQYYVDRFLAWSLYAS